MKISLHFLLTVPIFLSCFAIFPAFGALGFRVPLALILVGVSLFFVFANRRLNIFRILLNYNLLIVFFIYIVCSMYFVDQHLNFGRSLAITVQILILLVYSGQISDFIISTEMICEDTIVNSYVAGLNASTAIGLTLYLVPGLESFFSSNLSFVYVASEPISRLRGLADEPVVLAFFCYCGIICTIMQKRYLNSFYLILVMSLTFSSLIIFYFIAVCLLIFKFSSKFAAFGLITSVLVAVYWSGIFSNSVVYYQFFTKALAYWDALQYVSSTNDSGGFRAVNNIIAIRKYISEIFPFAVGPGNSVGFVASSGASPGDTSSFRLNTPIQNSLISVLVEFGIFFPLVFMRLFGTVNKSFQRTLLTMFFLLPPLLFIYPIYNVGIWLSCLVVVRVLDLYEAK